MQDNDRSEVRPPARAVSRVRIVRWVAGIVTCVASLWFLGAPASGGTVAVPVAGIVLACAMSIGAYVNRDAHGRYWPLLAMMGVFWAVATLMSTVYPRGLALDAADAAFLAGSACCVAWLVQLCLRGNRDIHIAIDLALTVIGAALMLWNWYLFAYTTGPGLGDGLTSTLLPLMDIVILTLAIHLVRQLPRLAAPHVWLVGVTLMLFVIHVTAAVLHATEPQVDTSPLQVPFLVAYFILAVILWDPRMAQLTQITDQLRERPSTREDTAFIVLAATPAISAAMIPQAGALDALVRGCMVTVIIGLLLVRLWMTLRALKASEARSAHRAAHDPLTGLLNRGALLERLEAMLDTNAAEGRSTVVAFLDCDKFKHINDTWGHHVGDALLREVSSRLSARLGPQEVVGRQGGDEFVVLAAVETYEQVTDLADRVRSAFAEPFRIIPGRGHVATTSIGIAVASAEAGPEVDTVLVRADTAMYEAKRLGPGRCVIADGHRGTHAYPGESALQSHRHPEPA